MENLQVFLNENLKKGKKLLTVQAGIFFKVIYHSPCSLFRQNKIKYGQNLDKFTIFFLNYLIRSKPSGRFFQIFVAFSEYLNFRRIRESTQVHFHNKWKRSNNFTDEQSLIGTDTVILVII